VTAPELEDTVGVAKVELLDNRRQALAHASLTRRPRVSAPRAGSTTPQNVT